MAPVRAGRPGRRVPVGARDPPAAAQPDHRRLNQFSLDARSLGQEDQRVAQALADVATIGILQQRSVHHSSLIAEQLQTALTSRVIIEQAKGLLVGHSGATLEEAFDALRTRARDDRRKLSDVAQDVVQRIISAESLLPRKQTRHGRALRPSLARPREPSRPPPRT